MVTTSKFKRRTAENNFFSWWGEITKKINEKSSPITLNEIFKFYKEPEYDRVYIEENSTLVAYLHWAIVYGFLEGWNAGIKEHGETAKQGWRENVGLGSCQVIRHELDSGEDFKVWYEFDFDGGNPNYGVAPALIHAVEWVVNKLGGRKTNQDRIAKIRGWV